MRTDTLPAARKGALRMTNYMRDYHDKHLGRGDDHATVIADMILDLMHLADSLGAEAETVLGRAQDHYAMEN